MTKHPFVELSPNDGPGTSEQGVSLPFLQCPPACLHVCHRGALACWSQAIIARTFDYESEAKCDSHLKTFMESIKAAANSQGQGFAAVKVRAARQPPGSALQLPPSSAASPAITPPTQSDRTVLAIAGRLIVQSRCAFTHSVCSSAKAHLVWAVNGSGSEL